MDSKEDRMRLVALEIALHCVVAQLPAAARGIAVTAETDSLGGIGKGLELTFEERHEVARHLRTYG